MQFQTVWCTTAFRDLLVQGGVFYHIIECASVGSLKAHSSWEGWQGTLILCYNSVYARFINEVVFQSRLSEWIRCTFLEENQIS